MKRLTVRGSMFLVAALALLFAVMASYLKNEEAPSLDTPETRCAHNLEQIGHAIWSYSLPPFENQWCFGVYPSGTISRPSIALEKRCGWASLIKFPPLGGDDSPEDYPHLDRELAWDDPSQQGKLGRDQLMFCQVGPKRTATRPLGSAVYIGIAGLGIDAPSLPTSDKRAGIFGDDRVVAPKDVTDGLAQTMIIAESSSPAGPWFAGGRNTVRGLDAAQQPYIGKGRQFGGVHAGGANVLMADGSVRFVKDTVAPKVFEAMSTIAGGEKVSVP